MKDLIKVFNETGACEINIEIAVKKWNKLWWISQYGDEYRLIKYKQYNSPITTVKVTISTEQANELIQILGLEGTPDVTFRKAKSWRKPEHYR